MEFLQAGSYLAILLLLVVSVCGAASTVNAAVVHVSVSPASVPVGKSFMIAFWIEDTGNIQWGGAETAMVHIRTCPTCSDIWQSALKKTGPGLDYEVYSSGINTPGTYVALVTVDEPGGVNNPIAQGGASFQVVGSTTPFDFSLGLSPSSVSVKQGETATFQVQISYSDPSYGGTSIDIQVSGLGPGMNGQVIPSPPTLRVSTSSSTPSSGYTITLTGSAKGVVHQAKAVLTVQVVQPFDFSISASPAQQTIAPGGSATSTVTVGLVSGTSQNVALTVSGVPKGASASLNPTSGTPAFSSVLSITTTASVASGQYALTITGTAGTTSHTTTFTLTIGQSPDFRIDVNPPSQTTTQGGTTTYQINVVSLNVFKSQVTLSVSGLPSGANGVFTITSGTPNFASALTVTLPANAPTGSFTLEVKGTGGGLNRAANLVLNISPITQTSTHTARTAQKSTQTSTQTPSPPGGDLMSMLQQNGVLILAAAILLVGAAFVALRRKKPGAPTQAAQSPRS